MAGCSQCASNGNAVSIVFVLKLSALFQPYFIEFLFSFPFTALLIRVEQLTSGRRNRSASNCCFRRLRRPASAEAFCKAPSCGGRRHSFWRFSPAISAPGGGPGVQKPQNRNHGIFMCPWKHFSLFTSSGFTQFFNFFSGRTFQLVRSFVGSTADQRRINKYIS